MGVFFIKKKIYLTKYQRPILCIYIGQVDVCCEFGGMDRAVISPALSTDIQTFGKTNFF